MTDDQKNVRKSHKLRGQKAPSSKDSANLPKFTSPNMLPHSLRRVEPITKLRDGVRFTKEDLLNRLHSDMRNEREQVENTLFPSTTPGGQVDYTPLSEIAIRHARRAELVSGLSSEDLETSEQVSQAICEGRIGDLEDLLRLIDCAKIEHLSEA